MSEPFVGEIRIFGFNFAPRSWAMCDGQLLAVSQNDALFSLLGTIYGGDGRTTFGVPDLRGRAMLHQGTGPGLSQRRLGSRGGVETVTLTAAQIPSHHHAAPIKASTTTGSAAVPSSRNNVLSGATSGEIYGSSTPTITLNSGNDNTGNTGGSQSHENMQPYLTLNICIALFGEYPSRS